MSNSSRKARSRNLVTARLDSDVMTQLKTFATKQSRSYSWIVRAALQKFLSTYQDSDMLLDDLTRKYDPDVVKTLPAEERLALLAERDAEIISE